MYIVALSLLFSVAAEENMARSNVVREHEEEGNSKTQRKTTSSRVPSPLRSTLHPPFSSASSLSSCLSSVSAPSSPPSPPPPPPPNPWNRNLAGGDPVPVLGEASSWPPLPSSSSSSASQSSASSQALRIHETGAAADTTAEPSRSEPLAPASASPSPPEEVDPPLIADSPEPTTEPAPDNAGAPRPAAPPNSGHQGHRCGRNRQGNPGNQFSRGGGGNFRLNGYNGNGGYPFRGPVSNWNPGFGLDPMLFGPLSWGVPPPPRFLPPRNGPLADYYNAHVRPAYPSPYQLEGQLYPEPNWLHYHSLLAPSVALPLCPGPVPHAAPPQPGTLNHNQIAAVQHQDLLKKLRNQIEYYFSDENLRRDGYLKSQMDGEGWVRIDTIARFPRVVQLTKDLGVIREALLSSTAVEIREERMRQRIGWERWVH